MADSCNMCLYFVPYRPDKGPEQGGADATRCHRGEEQDSSGKGDKAALCSFFLDAKKIRRRLASNLSRYEFLVLTHNGTAYRNRQIDKLRKEIEFDRWTLDVETRQVLTREQLGV